MWADMRVSGPADGMNWSAGRLWGGPASDRVFVRSHGKLADVPGRKMARAVSCQVRKRPAGNQVKNHTKKRRPTDPLPQNDDAEAESLPPSVENTPADGILDALPELDEEEKYPYTEAILAKKGIPALDLQQLKARFPLCTRAEDVLEVFCQPRLVPLAPLYNLSGGLSIDLLTGWNATDRNVQEYILAHVRARQPQFIMVCPPCTTFSTLQNLNRNNMNPEVWARKQQEGNTLLEFAMRLCQVQIQGGRFFVFEHPLRASSWRSPAVQCILQEPGVTKATFDQCRFGLRTKSSRTPVQKATAFLTNSAAVQDCNSS